MCCFPYFTSYFRSKYSHLDLVQTALVREGFKIFRLEKKIFSNFNYAISIQILTSLAWNPSPRHVNSLAAEMKTTKDRSLKQALAAFSFITVPSIRCCKTRMLLYLESGQVAMMNHCLGQAEANFRAIINNIISGKS